MRSYLTLFSCLILLAMFPACTFAPKLTARDSGEPLPPLPDDVDVAHPVYMTSFDDPAELDLWRLEGGRRAGIKDGKLVMESNRKTKQSTSQANHLVNWLTKEVPADFLLEFVVRPENRKRGLNIVFFNARGLNGENIFEPPIKKRTGLFVQYIKGDINNYHISYWAGTRGTANCRKNKGFALVAEGKDLIYTGAPESFQVVRLYKRGGLILLTVDGEEALRYEDDGKKHGPIHDHSGWIGLRQMAHTQYCEYEYLRIYPLKPKQQ